MQPFTKPKKRIDEIHIEEDVLSNILYSRKYTSLAQNKIEEFNNKYFNALISLKEYENDINFDSYFYRLYNFSNQINEKLIITNEHKLKLVLASIDMADIILNQGIKNKDLEYLTTAFYGLNSDLESLNIFKN